MFRVLGIGESHLNRALEARQVDSQRGLMATSLSSKIVIPPENIKKVDTIMARILPDNVQVRMNTTDEEYERIIRGV